VFEVQSGVVEAVSQAPDGILKIFDMMRGMSSWLKNFHGDERYTGKNSLENQVKGDDKLASIPLDESGLEDWRQTAKQFGLKYEIVRDSQKNPPEFTVRYAAKDADTVARCFKAYIAKMLEKHKDKGMGAEERRAHYSQKAREQPTRDAERNLGRGGHQR